MTNRWFFTNTVEVHELAAPTRGAFIHGLFMEGAGWEEGMGDDEGYATDSKMKDLHPLMPVTNVYGVHINEMSWENVYHCSVFITTMRGATFVVRANVRMDADDNENR